MSYIKLRSVQIQYNVQISFQDKECDEFLYFIKKTPRKIKKVLKRIAKKEPSILEILGIEEDSKEIVFSIPKDGRLHKWLKNCRSEMVQNKAASAMPDETPISFIWM